MKHFENGIPDSTGWYLVKLQSGSIVDENGQKYDVDYCYTKSPSDGGGHGWVKWYQHNITDCWKLPTA